MNFLQSHPRTHRLAILVAFAVTVAVVPAAQAYERYNSGCDSCHGGFTSGGYVSEATGADWPSSLHTVHRSSSYMDTDCDLCHRNDDNDNAYIGSSNGTAANGAYGCVGCHGSPSQAGAPTGDSLRRHHTSAGVSSCANTDCHAAPMEIAQEVELPPYYGTVDTLVAASCNDDGNTSEDWNNDGQGLDNDGDMFYDGNDPACREGFIFHDAFVSGDTTSWDAFALMRSSH